MAQIPFYDFAPLRILRAVFNFGLSLCFAAFTVLFRPDPAVLHNSTESLRGMDAGRHETRTFRDRLLTRQTHSPPRNGLTFGFSPA